MRDVVDPLPGPRAEYEIAARRLKEVVGEPQNLAQRVHLRLRLRALRRSIVYRGRRTAAW